MTKKKKPSDDLTVFIAATRCLPAKKLASCAKVHGCDYLQSWKGRLICQCGFQTLANKRDAIIYNVCISTTEPKLDTGPQATEQFANGQSPLHHLSVVPCEPLFELVFDVLFDTGERGNEWPESTDKTMKKVIIKRDWMVDVKI